nr:MAG TPA: hypothetical protein [Caudoviricetes sp.]
MFSVSLASSFFRIQPLICLKKSVAFIYCLLLLTSLNPIFAL